MQIILGSQSPRRREILSFFTLPFLQIPSGFDEDSIPFQGDPEQYVTTLSQKKAAVLASKYPQDVILTADGAVFCHGKVYNKPANAEEARQFLRDFGGHWIRVITAVTVQQGSLVFSGTEETKLMMHKLSDAQMQQFHTHCHSLDKAGGFAIEKSGNLIVKQMQGCYYNVLGLPINTTRELLLKVGIDLWNHLKDC